MALTSDEFAARYPVLFHMAADNSWDSIRRHGLLSTSRLLDLFEVNGVERHRIESAHRPESVEIRHHKHGLATIRDQKPMSEKALVRCLQQMAPEEWYRLLNSMVFFWPTTERLKTMLDARAYRGKRHVVLTVDTIGLLRSAGDAIRLSPINSGNTAYVPRSRGADTFLPFDAYPFEERRRRSRDLVAEVTVLGGVAPISELTLRVAEWQNLAETRVIYRRQ